MNSKLILSGFVFFFLIGIATASIATITNVQTISPFGDFIAGGQTSALFSFDYPGTLSTDYEPAPIVVRVNITSLNDSFPVWKDDFQLKSSIQRYWLPELLEDLIGLEPIIMSCKENAPIQFKPKDRPGWLYTINEVPNGTFYCYNSDYYLLKIGTQSKLNLNISSNPALYPGGYNITVELMEMEPDDSGPEIILIEPKEEDIFSETNEIILIKLNITDMYTIDDASVKYRINSSEVPYDSKWIYEIAFNSTSKLYEAEFNMTEHNLTESGSYWIYAEAKDILGNEGKL